MFTDKVGKFRNPFRLAASRKGRHGISGTREIGDYSLIEFFFSGNQGQIKVDLSGRQPALDIEPAPPHSRGNLKNQINRREMKAEHLVQSGIFAAGCMLSGIGNEE